MTTKTTVKVEYQYPDGRSTVDRIEFGDAASAIQFIKENQDLTGCIKCICTIE